MAARQPLLQLAWFHIDDPASPELDELARRFNLHELDIEDCRHRVQRAKVEEHDDYIFVVLKHLHRNELVHFDDFDVFVGRDFIITVTKSDEPVIGRIRNRLSQSRVERLDRAFYTMVDSIVDEYMVELDRIGDEISDIEKRIVDDATPHELRRIFRGKRRLLEFRRNASGMREVVNTIMRHEGGLVGDDLDPYFRDIYDHLIRTTDLIETYRDLLTGTMDIYMSVVANRTNEVMKILTIWGTIALPLVIITGFFGMNLPLPWQQTHHGTLFAVLTMLTSTLLVLLYFKRKKWF